MVLDHRGGYLDTARLWMGAAVNPLYAVVQAPFDLWNWLTGSFADRARLRARERAAHRGAARRTRQAAAVRIAARREPAAARDPRGSEGIGERTLIAEIIHVDVDPFRHRVRINKGADDGVFKGQPCSTRSASSARWCRSTSTPSMIILISDSEHAMPVQVNRNGIRSIAVGTGDIGKLSLPYLTVESDVKPDDLLVSSGLDGIFPAGYPVARSRRWSATPPRRSRSSKRSRWRSSIATAKCCCCGSTGTASCTSGRSSRSRTASAAAAMSAMPSRTSRRERAMASSDGRISRLRITVTVIVALIFAIVPLPERRSTRRARICCCCS